MDRLTFSLSKKLHEYEAAGPILARYRKLLGLLGYDVSTDSPRDFARVQLSFTHIRKDSSRLLRGQWLWVQKDKLTEFENAVSQFHHFPLSISIEAYTRECLPTYATKDTTALIGVQSINSPISNQVLSLGWLQRLSDRPELLRQSWGKDAHYAALMTQIHPDLIDRATRKIYTGVTRAGHYKILLDEVINEHMQLLEQNLPHNPLRQLHNQALTYEKTDTGILNENRSFVGNMIAELMSFFLGNWPDTTAAEIDWQSIKDALRDLGLGINGAYGNSLDSFKRDYFKVEYCEGLFSLRVDPEYKKQRVETIRSWHVFVLQLHQIIEHFSPLQQYLLIDLDLNSYMQGFCPVASDVDPHQVHTFDWIVDLARETMLRFEEEEKTNPNFES